MHGDLSATYVGCQGGCYEGFESQCLSWLFRRMNYSDAIVYLKENNITKEDGTFYEFGEVCNSWTHLACHTSPHMYFTLSLSILLSLSSPPLPSLSSCQDIPEAPERAMTDKINEVRLRYSQNFSIFSSSPSLSVSHSLTPLLPLSSQPIFLCRFPAEIKSFYMARCPEDKRVTESVSLWFKTEMGGWRSMHGKNI